MATVTMGYAGLRQSLFARFAQQVAARGPIGVRTPLEDVGVVELPYSHSSKVLLRMRDGRDIASPELKNIDAARLFVDGIAALESV